MTSTTKQKRVMHFRLITEEEQKKREAELDKYDMKKPIKIKGKLIKTYGDLRPYIKSTLITEKFEEFLYDNDYVYFYNWILEKEINLKNKLKKQN
jgi:hypothetical protein